MTSRRILVTGAGGFIGGHLARELRPQGAVGVARGEPASSDTSIEWVKLGDGQDLDRLAEALSGVEVVVHAAGRAHVLREVAVDPLAAFREANVASTARLARAAARAGVRRFILISSVAVHGDEGNGRLDERTPVHPRTPYGVSRKEAEDAATAAGRESAMEVVSLRLPMVYGPGMKGNPLRLFDLVWSGLPLPLGAVRNERSMLYVGNLVAAVGSLASIGTMATPVTTFLAADRDPVSTPALVREIAEALGVRTRLVPVPLSWLRATAAAGNALLGERFPLSPDTLERLSGSLVVDALPLARLVGAVPFSRQEGIVAAARWYRDQRARAS